MAYRVKHIRYAPAENGDREYHGRKVQEALDEIGEEEIYDIQHSFTIHPQSGQHRFSTLIVYRTYKEE